MGCFLLLLLLLVIDWCGFFVLVQFACHPSGHGQIGSGPKSLYEETAPGLCIFYRPDVLSDGANRH